MGIRLRVRPTSVQASSEATYEFDQSRIVLGRGSSADVRLPHRAISATHATIRVHDAGHVMVDEGATNGTRVNGVRIAPGRPKPLRPGDVITIGEFELLFEAGVAVAQPTSVQRTAALARQLVREVLDAEAPGAERPRLVVLNGTQQDQRLELPAPPARFVVGRDETCDLALNDADASREHIEVIRDLDGTLARDLDSKNGLIVNDRPETERRLRDRDEVVVGSTLLVFEEPADRHLRLLEEEADLEQSVPPPSAPDDSAAPRSDVAQDGDGEGSDATRAEQADVALTQEDETAPRQSNAGSPAWAWRESAPPPASPRSGPSIDAVIFILAGTVLALSLAGLILLLHGT